MEDDAAVSKYKHQRRDAECEDCMRLVCEICGHTACPICLDDCDNRQCLKEETEGSDNLVKTHKCVYKSCGKDHGR